MASSCVLLLESLELHCVLLLKSFELRCVLFRTPSIMGTLLDMLVSFPLCAV